MISATEIEQSLWNWAPRELAFDWDNVGLLLGRPEQEIRRCLVALDITPEVVTEAVENGMDLIISHHPLMNCHWQAVQSIREDQRQGRMLTELIRHGIAAICMHTNLDAAPGGVNDLLAQQLGLEAVKPFSSEKIGRIGQLKSEIPLVKFLSSVVQLLNTPGLRYRDAGRPVYRVAVGGGACTEYIEAAKAAGCDTFVTGDVKYHEFLEQEEINLIDAGHFPTEDVICSAVVTYLKERFPGLSVVKSTSHRDVIQYFMKE